MEEKYCDNGKKCYDSHKQATADIKSLSEKHGRKQKFSTYKCNICGCFHIATVTKRLCNNKKKNKYPFRINFKKKKWK